MWIRSQNRKSLVPNNNTIEIVYNQVKAYMWLKEKQIGIYKTEERALEVLDEIQKRVTGNQVYYDLYDDEYSLMATHKYWVAHSVYEMPKE